MRINRRDDRASTAGTDHRGDHLVARSNWGQGAPGILILSHLDTVHLVCLTNWMGHAQRVKMVVEMKKANPGGWANYAIGAFFFIVALFFVHRSFYGMRIPEASAKD